MKNNPLGTNAMRLRSLALVFLAAWQISIAAVRAETAAGCGVPAAENDGWQVAAPETVGLDGASLCALEDRFRSLAEADLHGVLVVRHRTLVYEQYFAGEDQSWGHPLGTVQFHADTRHDLRSVTKSVTSLLVGIAIGRNLIAGVEEPMFQFFPEYADLRSEEKDRILLRHLLTMSMGLE